ncbi:MAG: hypothetical protein ACYDH9_09130 [Limisphaerales bacterium]
MLRPMNEAVDNPEEERVEPGKARRFEVVVAYEDFATGIRAKKAFDGVLRELGSDLTFNCKLWKFDILRIPQLKEMAADDAAEADMVLIAAHSGSELPAGVKKWIDLWVTRRRPGPRALVSLLDPEEGSPSGRNLVCNYLHQVSERGHMDFFCACTDSADEEAGFSCERIGERAGKTSSLMEQILRRSYPPPQSGIHE